MNKAEKRLLDRDREFCKASQHSGSVGWESFLMKDALMGTRLHEPYIEGRAKITKLIGFIYALDQLSFTWEPLYAFCSEDETLGVTTGVYTRTYYLEGTQHIEEGKYVSTWVKHKGEWLIAFDIGN